MSIINQPLQMSNEMFLNKMQHLYSKKGSQTSMSSYKKKNQFNPLADNEANFASLNPIKKQHLVLEKKWESIQSQLQLIVKPFKESLDQLLHNINEQNKFYKILQIMRKDQLLSDIAESINQKMIKQNFAMKRQLQKLKLSLVHLSKTHRQFKSPSKKNNQTPSQFNPLQQKIDSTRSMPENIYLQAKLMSQPQFVQWCDKILMKNKLVITDLKRHLTPKKSLSKTQTITTHQRSLSAIYDKDAEHDHPNLFEKYSSLVNRIQQLSPLTEPKHFQQAKTTIINQLQTLKLQKLTCPKFCCSLQKQKLFSESMRSSNNQLLVKSTDRSRNKSDRQVYRDNKTQEYFNRYYKHPSFKMNQIKSVQHTKGQQMNRLENLYHRMLEHRSKLRYGY